MRSMWRTLDGATLRTIVVMTASIVVIGASYGVAAESAGFTWWQILVVATVVLAGSSEFVFVGILVAGGLPIVAALAGLLLNTRNFGYGLAVGRHLGRGLPMVLGAHLINDESAAIAGAEHQPRRARAAFFLSGAAVLISWPLGSQLGVVIGRLVPDPSALGLDAALPALLAALALPALRQRSTLAAAVLGGAIAVAVSPVLPAGLPILLGLIGLVIVEVVLRRRAQAAPEVTMGSEEFVEAAR
ncbi:AzlC family ABC transporter permease [Gordonia sp. CPCC 205515]|uniref:AzlC family ABC transporter permease n=1 Tax=Gordonia sp. CPCC 205515 TaxID=3140791 RepID=UPI003AF3450E